jgi:26S proteasome regulatory subunit N8
VFNLLPNLDIDAIIRAFTLQTNDMMLVVYVSSVVRLV